MNILEIDNKYYLPENVQMYMLRLAVCSNLIIDNCNGLGLDKEAIISVCLLHDIRNISNMQFLMCFEKSSQD